MSQRPLPDKFVSEDLGSATRVALDGRSELEGFVTKEGVKPRDLGAPETTQYSTRGAPWGIRPSLVDMTHEVGIDFDKFIDGIAKDRSDTEMAEELGVNAKTIGHLKNHFWRYGINDIQGQD
ncbi:hypothetical protein [Heliorestis convoluta]|uniref:Uncharacterized protein n=1 Tax=Heliorestis convoluta TaxID=356322 RepID=A0A5Q2N305_9FIRM|nr:hypothetical protein [Heliorestis convoluta]QGG48249.1 hypothetical protein FTV88_2151 [Heliorestis convoluta]